MTENRRKYHSTRPEPPRPVYPDLSRESARRRGVPVRAPDSNEKPRRKTTPFLWRQFGPPSAQDWLMFSNELRTLYLAGFPLIQSLNLLAENTGRERVKRAAVSMSESLASGVPLETVLTDTREVPGFIRTLLGIGNRSGRVGDMLDVITRHYRWMIEIRRNMMKIAWYPLFLIVAGSMIMALRDAIIISNAGSQTFSQALFNTMLRYVGPVLFGFGAGYFLTRVIRVEGLRARIDSLAIHIPVLGGMIRKYSVALFLEIFASLLEAGVPIVSGYQIAADSVPNLRIRGKLLKWKYFLEDGESLTSTLEHTGVFKQEAIAMVAAGEVSASAPFLMRKVSTFYNEDVRLTIELLTKFIGRLLLVPIAVGFFIAPEVLAWLGFVLVFLIFLV